LKLDLARRSDLCTVLTRDRLFGFAAGAFDLSAQGGDPVDPHFIPLTRFTPGRFLSSPEKLGHEFGMPNLRDSASLRTRIFGN
jgi:hypothetical protein